MTSSTMTLSTGSTDNASNNDLKDLEERASRVVLVVQKCVEILRTTQQFNDIQPAALWSAVKQPSSTARSNNDSNPLSIIASVDIFSLMKEGGVVEALVSQSDARGLIKKDPMNSSSEGCDDSRHQLTLEVLLPLALALSDCYKLLDDIPSNISEEAQHDNKLNKKKKKPPPPPPGLLSLQNYTDISAFLEFTVCTAILPFLQPYVLFPVEDRARYFLPKSLAGRISRPSLLWGSQQRKRIPHGQHETIMKQVTNVLQRTVVVLGKLLLLDRFRPMLLPRHLSDLYAAIFQAEAYTMRIQQMMQKQATDNNMAAATTTDPSLLAQDFQNMVAQLLPKGRNDHALSSSSLATIDPGLQAQALQTLLLQGTRAPSWLKQRVAKHLTDMATQNLSVIIQVFVHAAPPKDKTAASLRLARTLLTQQQQQPSTTPNTSATANPSNNTLNNVESSRNKYHNLLCHQIMQLLDTTVDECYRNNVPCIGHPDSLTCKQTLDIHTLWAILDQLPTLQMQDWMLCHLSRDVMMMLPNNNSKGMEDDDSYATIHRTVNRMAVLLSSIPPSYNPAKVALVLLMPLKSEEEEFDGTESTIFGQLLRLASLRPSVLKSSLHDDAVLALRLALKAILQSNFSDQAGRDNNVKDTSNNIIIVDSVEVLTMALVYAAAPSNWDNSGYSYSVETQMEAASSSSATPITLSHIRVVQAQNQLPSQEETMSELESRVNLILDKLLVPIVDDSLQDPTENEYHRRHESLASKLFHLVLLLYFSSNAPKRPLQAQNVKSMLPALFDHTKSKAGLFRIVAMFFLPLLCEKCPVESLLKTSEDDGAGIFGLMQLVFSCAGPYFGGGKVVTDSHVVDKGAAAASTDQLFEDAGITEMSTFVDSGVFFSQLYCSSIKTDGETSPGPPESSEKNVTDIDTSDIGMVLSVTSLVLGLLVAIMEHGTKSERSVREEAIIASFPMLLQPLAEASDISWMRASVDNDSEVLQSLHTSCGEVAEMAGHALALIAARTATSSTCFDSEESEKQQVTPSDVIERTLRQSMADLSSTQPPMRARGIVSLQRLLRGSLFQTLLDEQKQMHQPAKKSLIVDLDEANEEPAEALVDKTISQILEIAISAISDSESYVYLAAIQCIAAAADCCPNNVIPRVGLAVATGNLFHIHETHGGTRGRKSLSSAQRVKLAEALIFCVRRRAKVDEYVTILLDFMIFGGQRGKTDDSDELSDAEKVNLIQRETHDYFIRGRESAEDDTEDLEERAEKQRIRVNAGGPIFAAEEADLVTAARVSVVSELLSAAHPSMLARYSHALAMTAVELLRLEASRPVRRAAALLAREFYTSVLREQNELLEMVARPGSDAAAGSTDLELSTALMETSDDDVLHATLKRSVQADDLGDVSNYRVFDAATVARCQEALDMRQGAVDGGLFVVAKLVVEYRKLDNKLPAGKLVRNLMQQSRGDTAAVTMGSLSSSKVDMSSLELE